MNLWEYFEKECINYLNNKFGNYADFFSIKQIYKEQELKDDDFIKILKQ